MLLVLPPTAPGFGLLVSGRNGPWFVSGCIAVYLVGGGGRRGGVAFPLISDLQSGFESDRDPGWPGDGGEGKSSGTLAVLRFC